MATVDVVVGGQYGSEGKGHVSAQVILNIIENGRRPLNIRVAGPNAGHTVIDANGVAFPLRTVPVGGALPGVDLYIASGSEIEIPVLLSEVELLRSHGHPVDHLYVSGEATILTEEHHEIEGARQMHAKIGSTGKGIGAARADRIMRTAKRLIDDEDAQAALTAAGVHVVADPLEFVARAMVTPNAAVVIEGTQGYGLGLHTGHYPQCTSSDTRAVDFLAMAGISPWGPTIEDLTVWVCARVYPIRVAGNSGPMEGETTWEELGLTPEKTTVTHKTRRVARWDAELIRRAVVANGGLTADGGLTSTPTVMIALTMADQKIPAVEGKQGALLPHLRADAGLNELVAEVEHDAGVPVGMVTTSPSTALWW